MMLEVQNLNYMVDGKKILRDINMSFKSHKFIGIVGPNGAGKSTLLKNIYGNLTPNSGEILVDGKNLKNFTRKQQAQKIAVLAQEESTHFDFTVAQIVEMGRYPYKGFLENYSKKDKEMARNMLRKAGVEQHINRSFASLSGGEKQRVLIARALVQETPILILDEPTNHLDINYQLQLLNLIKHLNITVISALHDLNIASIFCDEIYVMKDGKNVINGIPEEVITVENLKNIFGIDCYVSKNPLNHKMQISYMTEHYHIDGEGAFHSHDNNFTGSHIHN